MGPAGREGDVGYTGAQGSSYAGPAGPMGPRGPAGEQGATGDTGMQGATLVGPKGRTGRTGSAGEQGVGGETGSQGMITAGIAGEAGPSGYQGERGYTGATGDQGAVGIVYKWTAYREFNFDRDHANIPASEMDGISEIAAYLAENPSLEVGIDGSLDTSDSSQRQRDLSDRRANSVNDALLQAGVPASQIRMGAFADPDRRHQGQIQVLIKTRS